MEKTSDWFGAYWNHTAAVRIEQEVSQYKSIRHGVQQGCVFSLDLFKIYSENFLRELEGTTSIIVGKYNLSNVW